MHIWWEWLAVILKLGWNLFDIWYSRSTKESDDVVFGWEESVALFLGWPYVFCSEEKSDARQTKCSKETPGQGRKTLIKQFRVPFFVFFFDSQEQRDGDACMWRMQQDTVSAVISVFLRRIMACHSASDAMDCASQMTNVAIHERINLVFRLILQPILSRVQQLGESQITDRVSGKHSSPSFQIFWWTQHGSL